MTNGGYIDVTEHSEISWVSKAKQVALVSLNGNVIAVEADHTQVTASGFYGGQFNLETSSVTVSNLEWILLFLTIIS